MLNTTAYRLCQKKKVLFRQRGMLKYLWVRGHCVWDLLWKIPLKKKYAYLLEGGGWRWVKDDSSNKIRTCRDCSNRVVGTWGFAIPFCLCVRLKKRHDKKLNRVPRKGEKNVSLTCSFRSWLCYITSAGIRTWGIWLWEFSQCDFNKGKNLMDYFWRVEQSGFPRRVMLKWIMKIPYSVMQLLLKVPGNAEGAGVAPSALPWAEQERLARSLWFPSVPRGWWWDLLVLYTQDHGQDRAAVAGQSHILAPWTFSEVSVSSRDTQWRECVPGNQARQLVPGILAESYKPRKEPWNAIQEVPSSQPLSLGL